MNLAKHWRLAASSLIGMLLIVNVANSDDSQSESRTFDFRYKVNLSDLPKEGTVKVWVPIAESGDFQSVEVVSSNAPTKLKFNRDDRYGNQIGYCEFVADGNPQSLEIVYRVSRKEVSAGIPQKQLTPAAKKLFLKPNALVPIGGKPLELLNGKKLPVDTTNRAKAIYGVVLEHMSYDKSQPGYGNGDATWACDSRTGNCTDFHSLFISIARSRGVPAKFEIGFPIGSDPKGSVGGYHCWAWFHDDLNWVPVDISEADKHPEMQKYYFGNLTADRIAFSTGRDIVLNPKSNQSPLNYFIYPHVEVDGVALERSQVDLDFSYSNVASQD